MAQYQKHYEQDLTQDLKIRREGTIVFSSDADSVVITVDILNGGEPATLSGSVAGAVICEDGSTVAIDNGSVSGNTVSMTLTAGAVAMPGQLGVGIQLITGDVRTTILKAIYNVELFETDNVVDPSSRITLEIADLIADIDEAKTAYDALTVATPAETQSYLGWT